MSPGERSDLEEAVEQADEPEDLGRAQQDIVNGSIDLGHYQVVKVAGSVGSCTGTMVSSRTVVTAAHCFTSSGDRVVIDGRSRYRDPEDPKFYLIESFSISGTAYRHPGWTGSFGSTDAAVVILDEMTMGPFAKLANSTPVGSTVTLVGYGYSSASLTDYGTLRYGTNQIDSIVNPFFTHSGAAGSEATICFGDSGGPAFLGDYSSACQVGIAANTNSPVCSNAGGFHMRIDGVASWIQSMSPDYIGRCM